MSFDINDRLTATVGARWFDFEETRNLQIKALFGEVPDVDPDTGADLTRRTTSDSGFNPRILLSYTVNDDLTVNAQASKGFRLGGINDPVIGICPITGDPAIFGSETVWNYEVGFKSTLADGRVRLNASAYHMAIDGLQVADRQSCPITVVFNVPESEIDGASKFASDFGIVFSQGRDLNAQPGEEHRQTS